MADKVDTRELARRIELTRRNMEKSRSKHLGRRLSRDMGILMDALCLDPVGASNYVRDVVNLSEDRVENKFPTSRTL